MAEEPDTLIFEHPRAIRAALARVDGRMDDLGRRMGGLGMGMADLGRAVANQGAAVALRSQRLDGPGSRLGRMERRLDLKEG